MTFLEGLYCPFATITHCWPWTWSWSWVMNQRHPLCHVTKQLPPLLSFTEPGLGTQPVPSTWWIYRSQFTPAKGSRGKGSWSWVLAMSQLRAGRKTWRESGDWQARTRSGLALCYRLPNQLSRTML